MFQASWWKSRFIDERSSVGTRCIHLLLQRGSTGWWGPQRFRFESCWYSDRYYLVLVISNDIVLLCVIETSSHVPGVPVLMGWPTGKALGTAILRRPGAGEIGSMPASPNPGHSAPNATVAAAVGCAAICSRIVRIWKYSPLETCLSHQWRHPDRHWLDNLLYYCYLYVHFFWFLSPTGQPQFSTSNQNISNQLMVVAWKWRHWHLWLWRVYDLQQYPSGGLVALVCYLMIVLERHETSMSPW